MKYLWLSLVLFISGCSTSDIDKARSEYTCKDKGGVYIDGNTVRKAVCNNGEHVEMIQVIPDPNYYVKDTTK